MFLSLYALLLRTLVIDLNAKNQHIICKAIETSILKVLHGNTKSPTGSMYSWRYNILLEVKEGI